VRKELPLLVLILAVAVGLRIYLPWQSVFGGDRVAFLENDAWYHVRLIENQVRNWPWRVTLDPYAAPGGQYVPIAPFFDTITSTVVRIAFGSNATTTQIEQVAAFIPPLLGGLTIVALWALVRHVFEPRAALFGAAMLAIFPGHFLDRTLLGFYDHHALEALLAVVVLWTLARGMTVPRPQRAALAGCALGMYLLAWGSGAFLVGILGFWLAAAVFLTKSATELQAAGRVSAGAALLALTLVLVVQDSRMYRYDSQILSLAGFGGLALAIVLLGRRAALVIVLGSAAIAVAIYAGMFRQLAGDVGRLTPSASRMGVLEARPLFLYSGEWRWLQPWDFFRTGFFVGIVGLVLHAVRTWRDRRPVDLLLAIFTAAMFVATYGQNRFGYYLTPACAIVGGWLASRITEWGSAASPRREIAIIAVAGGIFAPNVVPTALSAANTSALPSYWRDALVWMRGHTPPPFSQQGGEDYYYARYARDAVPAPDYSVMNWWDFGYLIVQFGRRVPVANPTQERAPIAGRFYSATSESDAIAILARDRARYVLSDWELPFRTAPGGTIMGRFQNVLDWSGARHAGFYEVAYRREANQWVPVWLFYEPYYRSMAFRLSVLGGAAATPVSATSVVVLNERVDESGLRFKEFVASRTYPTHNEAATAAAEARARGQQSMLAGLDPWIPAFPLEPLVRFRELQAFRTSDRQPSEAPFVRLFEVR
jgi:dolichyl-diphosphooligosaccharide--protein glycosyltransferase